MASCSLGAVFPLLSDEEVVTYSKSIEYLKCSTLQSIRLPGKNLRISLIDQATRDTRVSEPCREHKTVNMQDVSEDVTSVMLRSAVEVAVFVFAYPEGPAPMIRLVCVSVWFVKEMRGRWESYTSTSLSLTSFFATIFALFSILPALKHAYPSSPR